MTLELAVVGTGLIGTSIALAARRKGANVYLLDIDDFAARTASAMGAGSFGAPPEAVDIAVLAVPPRDVESVLVDQQRRRLAHSYTDVASVKGPVEHQIHQGVADMTTYIGGHPLAGREKSGPLAARANLFEGRAWALTPTAATNQETLTRAIALASLCGAHPVLMESAAHDATVALTSHAPHLVSSMIASRLVDMTEQTKKLLGSGIRDVTRIANGNSELWSDIIKTNSGPVLEVVKTMHDELGSLLEELKTMSDCSILEREDATDNTLRALLDRGIMGARSISEANDCLDDSPHVVVSLPKSADPGPLIQVLMELDIDLECVTISTDSSTLKDRQIVISPERGESKHLLIEAVSRLGWPIEERSRIDDT